MTYERMNEDEFEYNEELKGRCWCEISVGLSAWI